MVAGCLVLGVAIGLLWRGLAPSGTVIPQAGYLFSAGNPELFAGQDVVFGALTAATGLLTGLWVALGRSRTLVVKAASAIVGGAAGSVVAWQVGGLLGPGTPTVPHGTRPTPVPAPLELHALGLLATWPAVTASVAFAVLLAMSLTGRPPR